MKSILKIYPYKVPGQDFTVFPGDRLLTLKGDVVHIVDTPAAGICTYTLNENSAFVRSANQQSVWTPIDKKL